MTTNDESGYLTELYQGEVLGEALFNKMLPDLDNDRERYVVATMLQLETETKARLRQVVAQRGLNLAEESAQRTAGEGVAAQLASMNWLEKMQRLQQGGRQLPAPLQGDRSERSPGGCGDRPVHGRT